MTPGQVEELLAGLLEADQEVALLEPRLDLDRCIVGLGRRFNDTFLVYDQACVIRMFTSDPCEADPGHLNHSHDEDLDPEGEAREYFEFNTVGAWIGPSTPAFLITED